jgi:hypothetical protein
VSPWVSVTVRQMFKMSAAMPPETPMMALSIPPGPAPPRVRSRPPAESEARRPGRRYAGVPHSRGRQGTGAAGPMTLGTARGFPARCDPLRLTG